MTDPKLNLTAQELNALQRVIELAWDGITQGQKEAKDQRSVWAASRALVKIKDHLKEQKQ